MQNVKGKSGWSRSVDQGNKLLYRIGQLVRHDASSWKGKHVRVIVAIKIIKQDWLRRTRGHGKMKKKSRRTGQIARERDMNRNIGRHAMHSSSWDPWGREQSWLLDEGADERTRSRRLAQLCRWLGKWIKNIGCVDGGARRNVMVEVIDDHSMPGRL